MSDPRFTDDSLRQSLSALMDGDADEAAAQRACVAWRGQTQARADWHVYHVIGDALRTPELAPSHRGDAAFLAALRDRLAREPVVMAPTPVIAPEGAVEQAGSTQALSSRSISNGWRTPMAVAAGFMAVAGVVFMTRVGGPLSESGRTVATGSTPALATVTPSQQAQTVVVAREPGVAVPVAERRVAEPRVVDVRDVRMLRDERLDRYLAAHRQYNEGAAAAIPGVTVRSVSTLAPDR